MRNNDSKIDFVGIGVQRCATTWIYECLKEHPKICMPRRKGDGYFRQDNFRKEPHKTFLRHCGYNQVKGEWTPSYYRKEKVPQRINEHNPQAKILISLRDPVQRAYSNYLSVKNLQNKDWQSFQEALDRKPVMKERGFYYKYLKKYYEVFSESNIKVVLVEDISKAPLEFIQEIYSFLGVNTSFEPESTGSKFNNTLFKLSKPGKFIHRNFTPYLRRSKLGRRIRFAHFIRRFYYSLADFYARKTGKKKPKMDSDTKDHLRRLYSEDIEKLEQLINKDLSSWKRDE